MTRQFALLLTVALVGCASTQEEQPPATTAAVIAVGVDARDTPRVAPKPTETFTDDQVLAILSVYNKGEARLNQMAHERSKDPRVLTFAKTLFEDHTAAISQEQRLADKLVMKPVTTDKMRDLERVNDNDAAQLSALGGHEFDVAFASNQVDRERDALAMLDVQLIPSSRVPDVRAHLADLRDRVDHHLRDAQELQRTLGGPIIAQK
ncbi:MAG TPA: DUF4142 domain-containing protein [Polyangiaceae bacterium]|jgi:putative membrane protein